MLYVTTRSDRDAFTAHRVLHENRAADGGLFVPFRDPPFSAEEIDDLRNLSFSQCVASVLNKVFPVKLTFRDVELAMGRYPVRLKQLNQRLLVGECFHNLESALSCTISNLTYLMRKDTDKAPGEWTAIAIRISLLFGIFGELMRSGMVSAENPLDIAVVAGDFSAPISVWYARKWGLPVGNIICCCNENANLWDFVCHGQLRTDAVAKKTITPDADFAVPASLERLIYETGGVHEVTRYLSSLRSGSSYYMDDRMLQNLRKGIYVTVNSEPRILSTIPAVYATHNYLLSLYSALSYAGLQDYRSRTGENRIAMIISEKSPLCDIKTVSGVLGKTAGELREYME